MNHDDAQNEPTADQTPPAQPDPVPPGAHGGVSANAKDWQRTGNSSQAGIHNVNTRTNAAFNQVAEQIKTSQI